MEMDQHLHKHRHAGRLTRNIKGHRSGRYKFSIPDGRLNN